jgi:hypothetical protein
MMTARHTITLLAIDHELWIDKYLVPIGWATVCFISLSGFTVGMLYFDRMQDSLQRSQITKRLTRRSGELIIVMFISNIVMSVMKLAVQGDVSVLFTINWWLGLFTLKTPYSISSILIPTALLIFISPGFIKAILEYDTVPTLTGAIILSLVLAILTTNVIAEDSIHYLLRRLLFTGDGFFPIIPMVLYGMISIVIGTIWRDNHKFIILVTVIVYFCLSLLYPTNDIALMIVTAISGPARLVIINFVSILLTKLRFIDVVTDFLSTIGQFSLQSFLLHRIILQALFFLANLVQLSINIELLTLLIFFTNLAGIWFACWARMQSPKLNTLLKTCYL